MSTIEERLVRDIAAVTGGVVVAESELEQARDVLEDRIESRRQRHHRRISRAVAVAAVVIPVVGFIAFHALGGDDKSAPPVKPGPTTHAQAYDDFLAGKSPTSKLVDGVWRVDNGISLLRFSPPDVFSMDDQGRLFGAPAVHGTYVIEGDLITVTVDGSGRCGGQTFAMRASVPDRGAMRFVHTQPGTGTCAPEFVSVANGPSSFDYVSWGLEQVLPTKNESLAGFASSDADHWQPLTNRNALPGDWMAQGGSTMLELTPGGDYYVADRTGEVVDRGRWALRGGTLALTSAATSPTCAKGDRLALGDLHQADLGTVVMRVTVDQNTCGGDWGPKTWIKLPQAGS